MNGHFVSPLAVYEPGLLPSESENARFQVILPKKRPRLPSVCLHLAGTGDHLFWRRRNFIAKPLAREKGIASVLLENPYYGSRKPKTQFQSYLNHVSDVFIMGSALVIESALLLDWCLKEGFQALGITGISMGGHMASVASCYWPHPIAIVPCLSWSTASSAFTEGVFSDSCAWPILQEQLHVSDYSYIIKQFCNIDATSTPNRPLQTSTHSLLHRPWSQPSAGLRTTSMDLSIYSKSKQKWRVPPEALGFMRQIMDTFSHLANFPKPHLGSQIISVVSKDDQYFLRDNVTPLTDIWPSCEVRYMPGGHVMGYLFGQKKFRFQYPGLPIRFHLISPV
jgi:hypothetical protein